MDHASLRDRMVDEQLTPRGIYDPRVLEVFRKVERHRFVPDNVSNLSYADYPLPVGEGQTISQPFMVALMTQSLSLKGVERVLEIGTGSGYQAAILAELAKEVYSIERFEGLADRAGRLLSLLGYANIRIKIGDGTLGWEEFAPFDRIIVTAGAPSVPRTLISQLADDGRMVIPVGGEFGQVLTLVEKRKGRVSEEEICGCVFVPLVGKEGWPASA